MEFEKHVRVRQEKFGAVVFETLREKVFVTNETGADILRLLEEGKETEKIISELAQKYNCNQEIIRTDTNSLIAALEENKILKNRSNND